MGHAEQKAKDSAMAAYMKAHKIKRAGSDATLPAVEDRIRKAIPAGTRPAGGWAGEKK